MARPITFDRNIARDRALRFFWRRGYQGAGLSDLLAEMKIGRSSFYAAFGDKRRLFLECLDHFAVNTVSILRGSERGLTPIERLRRFLGQETLPPMAEERGWGCMLVNTVVEMARIDDDLHDHAICRLEEIRSAMTDLLLEAGCHPGDSEDYSGFLMLMNKGLRVAGRQGLSLESQGRQVSLTFAMLESALPIPSPIEA